MTPGVWPGWPTDRGGPARTLRAVRLPHSSPGALLLAALLAAAALLLWLASASWPRLAAVRCCVRGRESPACPVSAAAAAACVRCCSAARPGVGVVVSPRRVVLPHRRESPAWPVAAAVAAASDAGARCCSAALAGVGVVGSSRRGVVPHRRESPACPVVAAVAAAVGLWAPSSRGRRASASPGGPPRPVCCCCRGCLLLPRCCNCCACCGCLLWVGLPPACGGCTLRVLSALLQPPRHGRCVRGWVGAAAVSARLAASSAGGLPRAVGAAVRLSSGFHGAPSGVAQGIRSLRGVPLLLASASRWPLERPLFQG